ncbi:hypothetical protein [Micrococcus terreus]|uniref:hypothetical protein n=1 Tax=Micrococcus terreus TaxID=574650 RepID=UPI003D710F0F
MIVFALAGVLFLIGGWGAYAGWNRRWHSRPGIYAGHLGPGLVLIGAGLVLMGLTEPIARARTSWPYRRQRGRVGTRVLRRTGRRGGRPRRGDLRDARSVPPRLGA